MRALRLTAVLFFVSFSALSATCHKFIYQDYARSQKSEYRIYVTGPDGNGMVKFVESYQGKNAIQFHRQSDLLSYSDAVKTELTCVYHFQGTINYVDVNGANYRSCQMSSYFFLLDNHFTLLSPKQRSGNEEVKVYRANIFNGIVKLEWQDERTGQTKLLTYGGGCR